MSRTPALLLTGVLVLGGSLALASPASAAPACDTVAAGAVHEVEETVDPTPVGPVTSPVIHRVIEPAACRLP